MKARLLFSTLLLGLLIITACQNDTEIEPLPTEAVPMLENTPEPITPTEVPATETAVEPTEASTDEIGPPPTEIPADIQPVTETTIEVSFIESAPKDTFFIKNIGNCALGETIVTINLAESVGKLIFDTTESGAGVEVFQPFEITEGQMELVERQTVNDGDAELAIRLTDLQPGMRVGFTIDVDDTLTDSALGNIQVTDSEISGGLVRVSDEANLSAEGLFGTNAQAIVSVACPAA